MFRITAGTLIIALFAVVLAALVAMEVRRRTTIVPVIAPNQRVPETFINVPIAARDLDPDRPLSEADIGILRLSQQELAAKNPPPLYLLDVKQIVGRVLRPSPIMPLKKGSFFQPDDFYSDRLGKTLVERLSQGFRAVTIKVDNVGSLDGHAVPGAFVDVIFRNDKAGTNMPVGAMTILADVEILAIGDNAVPGVTGGPLHLPPNTTTFRETTVTLAVPAEKANRLKVVEGRGTMSLVLRSKEDRDQLANYRPETLEGLMGITPAKGPFVSQMFRRGRPTTFVFSNGRVVDRRTYTDATDQMRPNFGVLVPLGDPSQPQLPGVPNQPNPTQPNPNLNFDDGEVPDFNGELLLLQQPPKLEFSTRD